MPKYKCKDCGAVWYGCGAGKICPKCEGGWNKFQKDINVMGLCNIVLGDVM